MKGHSLMSRKERRRKSVFDRVEAGQMSVRAVSEMLGLSSRHCQHSHKRFREHGDVGLAHRSRGRPSNLAQSKNVLFT